jgi:hypothetical protein
MAALDERLSLRALMQRGIVQCVYAEEANARLPASLAERRKPIALSQVLLDLPVPELDELVAGRACDANIGRRIDGVTGRPAVEPEVWHEPPS